MSVSTLLPKNPTHSVQEYSLDPSMRAWWPGRERLRPDFRIDRRSTPRWRLHGTATLLTLGVDLGIVVELKDLDCAPWWLAGESEIPLAVGMRVSVGFSNPTCRPNLAVVMRCERARSGKYRIAVRFEGALAC